LVRKIPNAGFSYHGLFPAAARLLVISRFHSARLLPHHQRPWQSSTSKRQHFFIWCRVLFFFFHACLDCHGPLVAELSPSLTVVQNIMVLSAYIDDIASGSRPLGRADICDDMVRQFFSAAVSFLFPNHSGNPPSETSSILI
jgi:hypothetical protein